MIFSHLLTNRIIISRLQSAGYNKVAMATVTATYVNRQALSLEKTQTFGGAMGKTYVIYCDPALDIQEGDKIKDENNDLYVVQKGGVTSYDMGGIDFLKVIITKVS